MAAAALIAAAAIAVAGCGGTPPPPASPPPSEDCPLPDAGFDCDFQRRIAAVQDYLTSRPGTTGIVLHDQQTGAVWRNDHAGDPTWTASTIKLAMVVDLFTRDHAGEITLTDDDRGLIRSMLHSSNDHAADTLWHRYSGDDHTTFNERFSAYGMTSLVPQKGYTDVFPYWGFQKCTPEDLDRLIHYVLTDLPEADRSYILGEMREVAQNQQWGVWGAGAAAAPGNKNGWSDEDGGWVMNSVGVVGPGERYTLAEMNNLRGEGGYDAGRETVTHVAKLLFAGRF
ncbi:MAG: tat pathway signal sequence [Actinophytocola sp.]|uniref:tat pathway signal sequence n=1 Tax=Actinophytocola sp. TaxID=1872138 RepID=UPI003C75D63F